MKMLKKFTQDLCSLYDCGDHCFSDELLVLYMCSHMENFLYSVVGYLVLLSHCLVRVILILRHLGWSY